MRDAGVERGRSLVASLAFVVLTVSDCCIALNGFFRWQQSKRRERQMGNIIYSHVHFVKRRHFTALQNALDVEGDRADPVRQQLDLLQLS